MVKKKEKKKHKNKKKDLSDQDNIIDMFTLKDCQCNIITIIVQHYQGESNVSYIFLIDYFI